MERNESRRDEHESEVVTQNTPIGKYHGRKLIDVHLSDQTFIYFVVGLLLRKEKKKPNCSNPGRACRGTCSKGGRRGIVFYEGYMLSVEDWAPSASACTCLHDCRE